MRRIIIATLAAFTSTMAHGQDDHGDATSSATCVAVPSATAGTINPGNDIDYFRFGVSETTAVVMETTGSLDTVGRFYDSNGRQVTGNHNSGEGGNFRIARTLSAGDYYVRVDSSRNHTGDYTLHLRGGDGSGDDHGDTRQTATCLSLPSATAGTINPGNDIDYFRFGVSETTAVVMETTGSLDTVGRLYDSNGRQVTGNHNSGEGGNFRIARELTQGEYYAYVGSYGGGTGDYSLQLRVDGVLSILTDGPSTVPPLATVPLTVLGGDPDAEYRLFMDLSGGGEFADDDTIEVTPVVSGGRLLVAAPLPETLAEGNAMRRFAVRVQERDGAAETTPLTFTLGRVNMPENLTGYPTVVLDVLLKGVYQGLDDPLLTVEAGAIDPGRSVRVAETLGLSMAYSDAQAEAILRSMFGVSITEASASGIGTAPSTHDALRRTGQAEVFCDVTAGDDLCDGYKDLAEVCVGDALNSSTVSEANSVFRRCVNVVITKIVPGWLGLGYLNRKIRSFGDFLSRTASRLVDHIADDAIKTASQKLFDSNAAARQIGLLKTLRTMPQTPAEAQEYYEALRGISQSLTERNPDLVAAVEREAATNGVGGDKRDALSDLVDEGDYHQSDAAGFADEGLEDVYTGEADVETLGSGDTGGAATCGAGYDEFTVDDKTSTCVWSSLVEPSCYAGSRQVSNPDLGGANACLYYSLDYLQPDGSCRENYTKVTFQGRETCRWAELGADRAAWYTLEKESGVESPQKPITDPAQWCWASAWSTERIWTVQLSYSCEAAVASVRERCPSCMTSVDIATNVDYGYHTAFLSERPCVAVAVNSAGGGVFTSRLSLSAAENDAVSLCRRETGRSCWITTTHDGVRASACGAAGERIDWLGSY